jgi:hypothetical protein
VFQSHSYQLLNPFENSPRFVNQQVGDSSTGQRRYITDIFTRGKPQMPRRGCKADILQAMSALLVNDDTPPTRPKARTKSPGKSPREERLTPPSILLAPIQAPSFSQRQESPALWPAHRCSVMNCGIRTIL